MDLWTLATLRYDPACSLFFVPFLFFFLFSIEVPEPGHLNGFCTGLSKSSPFMTMACEIDVPRSIFCSLPLFLFFPQTRELNLEPELPFLHFVACSGLPLHPLARKLPSYAPIASLSSDSPAAGVGLAGLFGLLPAKHWGLCWVPSRTSFTLSHLCG